MFKELTLASILLLPVAAQAAPLIHDGTKPIPSAKLEAEVSRVLNIMGEYSVGANKLLVETAAIESDSGHWKRWSCHGNYGTFQFRVDSARYLLKWAEKTNPALHKRVMATYDKSKSLKENLKSNVTFSAALVVLHYKERNGLTNLNSVQARAKSWKKNYNTYKGRGSVAGYVKRARSLKHA